MCPIVIMMVKERDMSKGNRGKKQNLFFPTGKSLNSREESD